MVLFFSLLWGIYPSLSWGQRLHQTWYSSATNTCLTVTKDGRIFVDELENMRVKIIDSNQILITRLFYGNFCFRKKERYRFNITHLSDSLLILSRAGHPMIEYLEDSVISFIPADRVKCYHDYENWPTPK